MRYDSINVSVDQLPFYYNYQIVQEINSLSIVAANHLDASIDYYYNGRFCKKITIPVEGPDALVGIRSIGMFKYSDGSIFIPSKFNGFRFLDLTSTRQTLIWTILGSEIAPYQKGNGMMFTQYHVANLSSDERYTAFQIWHPDVIGYNKEGMYVNDYPNTTIVDLETKELKFIKIPYPGINQRKNISFGHLDLLTYTFIDEKKLLVAFQNSPELRIVDIKTGEVITKESENAFQDLPVARPMLLKEAGDYKSRSDHYFKEPQYHQINFDPYRKLIYRVYKKSTEERSIFNYSQNYLLILDTDFNVLYNKNFNILYNKKLDPSIYPMLFPYKNGLVGLVKDIHSEQYLKLAYLEIE